MSVARGKPAPLCASRTIVAISDLRDGWPPASGSQDDAVAAAQWRSGAWGPPPDGRREPVPDVPVVGGYLERLPLAAIRAGLVDGAEIWHHWRPSDPGPFTRDSAVLARRAFHVDEETPPFPSASMRGFVQAFGAPHILCVYGLGVDASLLDLCDRSFKIYNSIDAPALRIPVENSARFDLVLTAADWQSREVTERHPAMPCAVLPIGPEFADPDTFRPLGGEKPYDVIYVAAAQPYKRHDILFGALAQAPRPLKALCVFGYGEMAEALRQHAADLRLDVDFVGPPGVPFAEVNRLMNLAKVGVVCGVDDGAPAILTEYMLAGLPVLANAELRCGLQYIGPETGGTADSAGFGHALCALVDRAAAMHPREAVLQRWTWPHSIRRLSEAMATTAKGRALLSSRFAAA